jgi:hypothetical protein
MGRVLIPAISRDLIAVSKNIAYNKAFCNEGLRL